MAHTARLHREEVGEFRAADMLDLSALEAAAEDGTDLQRHLMAPDVALGGLPSVTLGDEDGTRFCGGMVDRGVAGPNSGLVRVYGADGRFLGVGAISGDGKLAPKRVFHMGEKKP